MKTKKGQQEIIVTVLLVLIALAAVALIGTFVYKQVKTTTTEAQDKQDCLKVELAITNINTSAGIVTIQRTGSAEVALKAVNASIEGSIKGGISAISPGESKPITVTALSAGDKVEVFAVLASGYACSAGAEETAD